MLVKFVRDTELDGVKYKKGDTKEYPDPIALLLIETTSVVEVKRDEQPEPEKRKWSPK